MSTVYPTHSAAEPQAVNSRNESSVSAASWPAIFAGAVTAAATSLILAALGTGLGLAAISPWPTSGASPTTFSILTAIWLIVIQWVSALMGGYMTGRLRTKWTGIHTHEVFFRDTAHGFATWALSTVIGAVLLASAAGNLASKSADVASTVVASTAQAASMTNTTTSYGVDRLFRSNTSVDSDSSKSDPRPEVARILSQSLSSGDLSADDRAYLIKLVGTRTGVSESDAAQRVDQFIAGEKAAQLKAREAADTARKAAATASIFLALSMLIGAFISSAAAALGGRLRDLHN